MPLRRGVQPRDFRLATAVVMLGVPVAVLYVTVISVPVAGAERPEASNELNMFSTLVAVSDVLPAHVFRKQFAIGVPVQLSKNPAGKDVSEVQLSHVLLKLVPLLVLINGKDVRELQLFHVALKLVPLLVLINGKDAREVQLFHVLPKLVPLLVSINGKDVREVQLCHTKLKLVTAEKSRNPNSTMSGRALHQLSTLVPTTSLVAPRWISICRAASTMLGAASSGR